MSRNGSKTLKANQNVRFLLFIEAIKQATYENPKNLPELNRDVASKWKELFPDVEMKEIKSSTANRYIKEMKATGLYDIETHKDMKKGYYLKNFLFDAAEFSIIAQALYRSTTLSADETQVILNKFMHQTDDIGEGYLDILNRQIKRTSPRRKSARNNLPIMRTIMKAILDGKQIAFKYFNWDAKDKRMKRLLKDEKSGKAKIFFVSPYYLVWESDECYLIGHIEEVDEYNRPKKSQVNSHLSHFRISCITTSVHSISRDCTPIREMREFRRYMMLRTLPESMALNDIAKNTGDLKYKALKDNIKFSLDRYMRENLYMYHDGIGVEDVKLYFQENFIGNILARFNLDERTLDAKPTTKRSGRQRVFSAIVTVEPNEGFYMWLMGNSNHVIVVEPERVRRSLKVRLQNALFQIKRYEKGKEKDPIDYDELRMKKGIDESYEMFRDMFFDSKESHPNQGTDDSDD